MVTDMFIFIVLFLALAFAVIINPFIQYMSIYVGMGYSYRDAFKMVFNDWFKNNRAT